ncbi:type 1 glutamine amidotransferase domain-containing protein [Chthonobacter albigriseus]|uniref:type 1 glutamine amidotransferase domain-containing protein n=1 Tax=Chthonobacter albigriseus TaxID=1683161 RepID=UPI0015EF2DED|nr:type 1 glutamine amidotransferase domain-containing protein [Chthonobacter albigriseus]
MTAINQAKILILATDGFEQSELMKPLEQLRAQGATVHVASPEKTREPGKIRGWDQKDWGQSVPVDKTLGSVSVDDYDALLLPGGQINPDLLRAEEAAVNLVRRFVDSGKVVAAICHGPWLLVEADAVRGRKVTSYHSIKTDVKNAGGDWVDQEVVTDEGIITSRKPDDIDAFVRKIVEEIGEGRHERRRAA